MANNRVNIKYDGIRPYILEAIHKVNKLLSNEEFYESIEQHAYFNNSDISPKEIAYLLRNTNISIQIQLYYSMSPISKIDVYENPEQPHVLYLNIWQLERPIYSICNSIVHGCIHALNKMHPEYHFEHNNCPAVELANTAPFAIGRIAEVMLGGSTTTEVEYMHDGMDNNIKIIGDHIEDIEKQYSQQ